MALEMSTKRGTKTMRGRVVSLSVALCVVAAMSARVGATAEAVENAAAWRTAQLDPDTFSTPRSFQAPSFRVDDEGRVMFKGWFTTSKPTEIGQRALVEALPEDARPTRDEKWRVTMKGAERSLTLTPEGEIIVGDEYSAGTWFVLDGLEYDTAAAFEDASADVETCDASTGECGVKDEL
jgi:hypothetical protein